MEAFLEPTSGEIEISSKIQKNDVLSTKTEGKKLNGMGRVVLIELINEEWFSARGKLHPTIKRQPSRRNE